MRVVLSDLDDTLFDHAHATRAALDDVRAAVPELGAWSIDRLDAAHRELLERLHLEVLAGRLSIEYARIERFTQLLDDAAVPAPAERAAAVAARYRRAYEQAWRPVPGALALAEAIKAAGVAFVVVTNNVVAEQRIKIARCGLAPFVDALVTSEEVGVSKPDPAIFQHALARAGAAAGDAVMLGDAWATDIEGARRAGVRAVWLNRVGATRPDAAVRELRLLEPVEAAADALLGRRV